MRLYLNHHSLQNDHFPTSCKSDILTKTLREHFLVHLDGNRGSDMRKARVGIAALACSRSIFYGKTPYVLTHTDEVEEKAANIIFSNCPTWPFAPSISLFLRQDATGFISKVFCKNLRERLLASGSVHQEDEDEDEKRPRNKFISKLFLEIDVASRDKRDIEIVHEPFVELFELLGPTLKSFTITGASQLQKPDKDENKFLTALTKNCPLLEEFYSDCTRSGFTTEGLENFVDALKNTLLQFRVSRTALGVQNLSVRPAFAKFAQNVGSRLSTLSLSCTDATDELLQVFADNHCLENLTSLDLSGNQVMTKQGFLNFFNAQGDGIGVGSLQKIELSSTLADDEVFATAIKKNANTLKYLSMQCQSAGMRPCTALKTIGEYCGENFEELHAFDSTEAIDDEGICAVAKKCKNLKILNIMFGRCSSKSVYALAENCKNLRSLDISRQQINTNTTTYDPAFSKYITRASLMKLIENCPKLVSLTCDGDEEEDEDAEEEENENDVGQLTDEQMKKVEEINPILNIDYE